MSGYADVRWDFRKPGLVTEMSGLPSEADIVRLLPHVGFVPLTDLAVASRSTIEAANCCPVGAH